MENVFETLIALRNRRVEIVNGMVRSVNPVVTRISLSQIARLEETIETLEKAVGER
jgi:hypothetical protein